MSFKRLKSLPGEPEVQFHLSTTLAGQQENCQVRPVKGRSLIKVEHTPGELDTYVIEFTGENSCDWLTGGR